MKIGLIGATNAGKSTLFNRLIGQFRAIVTDIHGTTTDIIVHNMQVDGVGNLTFFDSPGLLDFSDEVPFIEKIVKNSDLLLFLIDDTVGVSAKDQHILSLIMENNKKNQTFLIVNKLDVKRKVNEGDLAISDYYSLGLEKVI
jgi:ferrous iron transport protein B